MKGGVDHCGLFSAMATYILKLDGIGGSDANPTHGAMYRGVRGVFRGGGGGGR